MYIIFFNVAQLNRELRTQVSDTSTSASDFHVRWSLHLPSARAYVGRKTLHQKNPPVLNWRCRLTQVDLYNGRKTGGWNLVGWLIIATGQSAAVVFIRSQCSWTVPRHCPLCAWTRIPWFASDTALPRLLPTHIHAGLHRTIRSHKQFLLYSHKQKTVHFSMLSVVSHRIAKHISITILLTSLLHFTDSV